MSKTALCEFGCGEKTEQEIIKFSDGYSIKVQRDPNSKDFHLCTSGEPQKKLDKYLEYD